jgi:hypothetical protein
VVFGQGRNPGNAAPAQNQVKHTPSHTLRPRVPKKVATGFCIERLWGIDFIQTTQQAAGTCAMISVSAGACFVFVRESLRTFYDPYTESQNNIERWIAETRVALAAPRPGAINLISGLPTS